MSSKMNVVVANYIVSSIFKVPYGLDLEDTSIVEEWYVRWDTLHIHYVDGNEVEIAPFYEASMEGDDLKELEDCELKPSTNIEIFEEELEREEEKEKIIEETNVAWEKYMDEKIRGWKEKVDLNKQFEELKKENEELKKKLIEKDSDLANKSWASDDFGELYDVYTDKEKLEKWVKENMCILSLEQLREEILDSLAFQIDYVWNEEEGCYIEYEQED